MRAPSFCIFKYVGYPCVLMAQYAQVRAWSIYFYATVILYTKDMLLHYSETGNTSSSTTVVFLHGLAGSIHYWDDYVAALEGRYNVLRMDLLGFGGSPESPIGYTPSIHCASIKETLDTLGVNANIILVGHSMGALLALRYATIYPRGITKLFLLGPPVFQDDKQAKQHVTKSKKSLQYLYYGPTSKLLCTLWCRQLRPLSKRLAPWYIKSVPKIVAADSVLHSWQSYSESLNKVIERQTVAIDLNLVPTIPVAIIYGRQESPVIIRNITSLPTFPNVIITSLAGGHHFPVHNAPAIIKLLAAV